MNSMYFKHALLIRLWYTNEVYYYVIFVEGKWGMSHCINSLWILPHTFDKVIIWSLTNHFGGFSLGRSFSVGGSTPRTGCSVHAGVVPVSVPTIVFRSWYCLLSLLILFSVSCGILVFSFVLCDVIWDKWFCAIRLSSQDVDANNWGFEFIGFGGRKVPLTKRLFMISSCLSRWCWRWFAILILNCWSVVDISLVVCFLWFVRAGLMWWW